MKSYKEISYIFEDVCVNVKILIAALWTVIMFLNIYVDHFALFEPGVLDELLIGEMAGFPITQVWLLAAIALMMIPSLMIFLSLALKAKMNRLLKIITGIFYIGVVIINMLEEIWWFYISGSIVEVILLLLTLRYAWMWPKEVVFGDNNDKQ